jgi:hypothetical protein
MEQIKKILFLAGVFIIVISISSCNDDFLSKNNRNLYTLSDTLYIDSEQETVSTFLQLNSAGNSDYTVFMQPKWLSFSSMHGKMINGSLPLSFSIIKDNFTSGFQSQFGTIILDIESLGFVSFMVCCTNFGSPTIQCSANSINFESSGSQTFTISNTSEGILNWNFNAFPDWLIISPTSGSLNNGNSTTITASLDFNSITPGQELSGSILIISNSATDSLIIAVHVSANAIIPSDERQINGIVTDAEYNHESGIMAICTKSPNSLIIFNTNTNESNTISLSKMPNCVSLSEDGHKAVIGCSVPLISYVDIDNLTIIKDCSIDCIPFDIVLGDNGWCYIAPTVDQWVDFRSLNLNSGELVHGTYRSEIYEKTIIRKIQGKPYLVGTRTTLSPSGILIFDITKGIARDTISYYHESLGKFWISEDGVKLYSNCKIVYYLPKYDTLFHSSPPPVFGHIESGLSSISALDECPAINSIFIANAFSDISGYSSLIQRFNTSNLNKTVEFNASVTSVTENGIKKYYESTVWYIFVNKEGTQLYAIKNLKAKYSKDYWTIETFHF